MRTSAPTLEALRNETARQLERLLGQHATARDMGEGWTGLPDDIAAMSRALVSLEDRLDRVRDRS